jgi:hypothetical protein
MNDEIMSLKHTTLFSFMWKELSITSFASEIIEIIVWINNKKLKIYGLYSPPRNKNLYLEKVEIQQNTIIIGDFNAASPKWGYNYYNEAGKI